jgi:STE24 endopeptidase
MIPIAEGAVPEHGVTQYNSRKRFLMLAGMLVSGAYLTAMGLWGGLELDHFIQPLVGENRWLEVVLMGVVLQIGSTIVAFPVHFLTEFVVEHRFKLSTQSFGQFMLKWLKLSALMLVFAPMLLSAVYYLLWSMPTWWWVPAAAMMFIINGLLGILAPIVLAPMFYTVKPLENPELLERFRRIGSLAGLDIEAVFVADLSAETVKVNACMVGMGKTKRVFLGDTLLSRFTPEELEVIFAHEVGHYAHSHLLKMIFLNAIVMVVGFLVGNVALKAAAVHLGHASFSAPSTLGLFILALSVLSAVAGPLQNLVARGFEYQADWFALDATENPTAFRSAFYRLVSTNKAELSPPAWKVFLFDNHPSTADRLDRITPWMISRGMNTDHILCGVSQ